MSSNVKKIAVIISAKLSSSASLSLSFLALLVSYPRDLRVDLWKIVKIQFEVPNCNLTSLILLNRTEIVSGFRNIYRFYCWWILPSSSARMTIPFGRRLRLCRDIWICRNGIFPICISSSLLDLRGRRRWSRPFQNRIRNRRREFALKT